jgi:hypothetical protein
MRVARAGGGSHHALAELRGPVGGHACRGRRLKGDAIAVIPWIEHAGGLDAPAKDSSEASRTLGPPLAATAPERKAKDQAVL